MKSRFNQLSLVILAGLFCAIQAFACTCGDLTVTQQRENASAVFLGTVVKKVRSNAVEKDGVQVTFKVRRVWKGDVEEGISVFTGATSDLYPFENLCAPPFKIGQTYIVFALGSEKLSTDVCDGTLTLSDGKGTMKELGKSRIPKTKPRSGSIRKARRARNYSYDARVQLFRRTLYR